MAYNANIPQANQRIKDSQSDLLGNFQELNTFLNVNHQDLNSGGDAGKHKFVQFPAQGASPATAATEVALFSRTSSLTSNVELAVRKQSSGSVFEFTSALGAQPGWTILPSGILLKWGNGSGSGNITVTFPVAATIPVFAAGSPYNILLTLTGVVATDLDEAVRLSSVPTASATQFTVYCGRRTIANTPTTCSFNYLAIGLVA